MKKSNRYLAVFLCVTMLFTLFGCSFMHEHEYDNACDPDCNKCGEIREIEHQYDNSCDSDCNICGEIREVQHQYDNDCDTDCNICGEIRGITHKFADWKSDEDGHTGLCAVCGEEKNEEHHYASGSDICDVCAYKAAPREFPSGYITENNVIIETKHLKFKVEKGIYVIDNLEKYADALYEALETVSGLSFTEGTKSKEKPLVNVDRSVHSEAFRLASEKSELSAAAYAEPTGVTIASGDLFIGSTYAIAHELAHLLSYRYTEKIMYHTCKTLQEGYAQYTTYRVLKYLEKNDPEVAASLAAAFTSLNDVVIYDPSVVYNQKAEYWLTHLLPEDVSGNPGYDIGMRMMWYLEETYGNYSEWLKTAEKNKARNLKKESTQIEVLKNAYGNDVFDGFYPWLKSNESTFLYNDNVTIDYSGTNFMVLYPHFNAISNRTEIFNQMYSDANSPTRLKYNNLYICVDEIRNYLENYKDTEADWLILGVSDKCTVKLYDADGKLKNVVTSQSLISLKDVSYFKLDGEGITNVFYINGYEAYSI